MSKFKAIVMKSIDNVATATGEILAGTDVAIRVGDEVIQVPVSEEIPFGHKFSIRTIEKNETILKYGEAIGAATEMIQVGKHVHVHNLIGLRGRGDLP
jgi:altronate dehydratase small subunit